MEVCEIDPFTASLQELRALVQHYGYKDVLATDEQDRDQYLFLLISHVVEPVLAKESSPVAIYDFPPSQAALAQVHDGVAHRFEVYYRGVELANGFHELTDGFQQELRFQEDNAKRLLHHQEACPLDEYFLAALHHGLPPCSGVALGVDRLLALRLNKDSIAQTVSFDFSRA